MQCRAEDRHLAGMDWNLDLAEKQYSVLYSISRYVYELETTGTWSYRHTDDWFNSLSVPEGGTTFIYTHYPSKVWGHSEKEKET